MSTPFATLGLPAFLTQAVEELGYTTPTPIQAAALPPILAGSDVAGQAATGSGKTAAFGLGLLARLEDTGPVESLILCPTRELAEQVATELRRLAQRRPNTRVVVVVGGRPFRAQKVALEHGSQVVVGTPGRIADHLRKGTLTLAGLHTLVLDEADRMLDMGFAEQVLAIVEHCPADRQTLLFSATFPEGIATLSDVVQRDPVPIKVASIVAPTQIVETVHVCEPSERKALLARLLAFHRPSSALVFCETRNDCDAMAEFLSSRGASALALHGGLEQQERDDVLVQFLGESCRILVATNVAARGIDIPELPMVVNAELTVEPESHVHRIGRTGRAGEDGRALSIVAGPVEMKRLDAIQSLMGRTLPRGDDPGGDGDLAFLAAANRTVLILSGRKAKIRKGDVLGALIKDGDIPSHAIGRIDLTATTCAVAIHAPLAPKAAKFLQRARVKNQRVRAVLL